ncbi:Lymphocyte antigen 75, partial [Ophiophagus hannah]
MFENDKNYIVCEEVLEYICVHGKQGNWLTVKLIFFLSVYMEWTAFLGSVLFVSLALLKLASRSHKAFKKKCFGFLFTDKSWLDGSEVKYTNWASETDKANGQCSVIFSANGTWSKADCNNEPSRVVCKIPQVSHHSRGAIAVSVIVVIALLVGLGYFLYRKMQLHSTGLASVRYERGMYDDETDTMFSRNDD